MASLYFSYPRYSRRSQDTATARLQDQQGHRLNDISALPDKDKEHILYTIDGLIKSAKIGAT